VNPAPPVKPLSERLRALVVQHAGVATLTCTFEPGGKHNGVGIASVLWCLTCRQARMWHDVAEGAALAAGTEASERLPFFHADVIQVSAGVRQGGSLV